jgi:hypothetical protein
MAGQIAETYRFAGDLNRQKDNVMQKTETHCDAGT